MKVVVKVIGSASGGYTPHNNRYVRKWNPHTKFGTLDLVSVKYPQLAREFEFFEVLEEWKMVSNTQETRPDGKPNRPLTGVTIEIVKMEGLDNIEEI